MNLSISWNTVFSVTVLSLGLLAHPALESVKRSRNDWNLCMKTKTESAS